MDHFIINKYWKLIEPLGLELKLELLAKLTESIKNSFKSSKDEKEELLNELFGAWSDIEDSLIEEIYSSRSTTDKNISFD
jgi:hypothetical protein